MRKGARESLRDCSAAARERQAGYRARRDGVAGEARQGGRASQRRGATPATPEQSRSLGPAPAGVEELGHDQARLDRAVVAGPRARGAMRLAKIARAERGARPCVEGARDSPGCACARGARFSQREGAMVGAIGRGHRRGYARPALARRGRRVGHRDREGDRARARGSRARRAGATASSAGACVARPARRADCGRRERRPHEHTRSRRCRARSCRRPRAPRASSSAARIAAADGKRSSGSWPSPRITAALDRARDRAAGARARAAAAASRGAACPSRPRSTGPRTRALAGEHLVEHAAERVEVRAPVDRRRPRPARAPCTRACRRSAKPRSARSLLGRGLCSRRP